LPVPGWRDSYAPNNDQTGDLPIRRKGPLTTIVQCGKQRGRLARQDLLRGLVIG
jgi:hypothetical protein